MSERIPKNLLHDPITPEQKISGLARMTAGMKSRNERGAFAHQLKKIHGHDIAQAVVDEARQLLRDKRKR